MIKKYYLFLIILIFASCSSVPLTERKQLRIIPQNQLLSMSFQQYEQVKQESKLSTDKVKVDMINNVGARISKSADEFVRERNLNMRFEWEFILIEDDNTINAWCMPGGKVAFYTGILPLTENADGVAVVMGHEIAHALADHGNERMSQGLLVQLGGMGLDLALSKEPQATRNLWFQAYGLGAQVGMLLPYSRKHEYEADYIGLILMAKAGYDPYAAVSFWERMSKLGGQKPPEFLSTHPADESRVAKLKEHLPEAMKYYSK